MTTAQSPGHSDETRGRPRVMTQPATVLFLAANPVQLQQLQLGEECRAIEAKIQLAKFRNQIRFRSRWAARPHDLVDALNEDSPAVLHFSGHGSHDQGLCFQSDDGSTASVSAEGLAKVMQAAGDSVAVVVLNACYSEAQAQALIACVPCVIGVSSAIRDETAIVYIRSFYGALAFGKSVSNAHEQGLAALAIHPASGSAKRDIAPSEASESVPFFKLLTRPGINPDNIYIVHTQISKSIIILKAKIKDCDATMLARIVDELRELTTDLHLEIIQIKEGSVQLDIALSTEAQRKLMKLWRNGQLTHVCGFEISSIIIVSPDLKFTTIDADNILKEVDTATPVVKTKVTDHMILFVYDPTAFTSDTEIESMLGELIDAGEVTLEPGIYRLPANAQLVPLSSARGSGYHIVTFNDRKGDWPDPPAQAVQQYSMGEIENFLGGAGVIKKI